MTRLAPFRSAHVDTFADDNLPPPELQPEFIFELAELQFPERLNCAVQLLDRHIEQGHGGRVCIRAPGVMWTYTDLKEKSDRIAHALTREMGVVAGNRVLLRAPNNPMLAACWFAVIKAGAIAVATMPLLRAKELSAVISIAKVTHALCDARLRQELEEAARVTPPMTEIRYFNDEGADSLEALMARRDDPFAPIDTAAEDICIFGFTSGTTGVPKATMHHHRDVMAICLCWPPHVLKPAADDVFIGSPPLAFTFGLGGLLLFPMSVGASTVLLERAGPPQLIDGLREFGATILFTAPTSYRAMEPRGAEIRATRLRRCVSAGEALSAATRDRWRAATGIEILDGLGATEMLHIFVSSDDDHVRSGATGVATPGYRAEVVDDDGNPVAPGTVGALRVKGPTGCRYLADERQRAYVRHGWNYTGDAYRRDEDGFFFYHARTDDMIISAGYNIAGPEVEEALVKHAAVADCAVVGAPDEERGQIVKAFVVLRAGFEAGPDLARELQDFVKASVAPYKYPRAIRFVDAIPRTPTGKTQRFKLREADRSLRPLKP